MLRTAILLLLPTLAGCASSPVQCAPCPGSLYTPTGLPPKARFVEVTVCIADLPCTRDPEPVGYPPDKTKFIDLPDGTDPESLEDAPITVTVLTARGIAYAGEATLAWKEGGDGQRSCSGLFGTVGLTRTAAPTR